MYFRLVFEFDYYIKTEPLPHQLFRYSLNVNDISLIYFITNYEISVAIAIQSNQ